MKYFVLIGLLAIALVLSGCVQEQESPAKTSTTLIWCRSDDPSILVQNQSVSNDAVSLTLYNAVGIPIRFDSIVLKEGFSGTPIVSPTQIASGSEFTITEINIVSEGPITGSIELKYKLTSGLQKTTTITCN